MRVHEECSVGDNETSGGAAAVGCGSARGGGGGTGKLTDGAVGGILVYSWVGTHNSLAGATSSVIRGLGRPAK